jgi:hypothetical protein
MKLYSKLGPFQSYAKTEEADTREDTDDIIEVLKTMNKFKSDIYHLLPQDERSCDQIIWNDGSGQKLSVVKGFIGDKPIWTLKMDDEAITCGLSL